MSSTPHARKTRARTNLPELALRVAGLESLWRPLIQYDPVSRYYARLASEPEFEAWLLTWVPGQGTEWHDHGGSAGAFVTLQGTLTELHATVGRDEPPRIEPTPKRLVAGSLRPFGTKHVHRVTNQDLEPAVSLHVYAPALLEMNQYRTDGDRLQLVASELAGVNW
jgi:predicted metal-dependent enzyme (double-stranded beta helix superfamily)